MWVKCQPFVPIQIKKCLPFVPIRTNNLTLTNRRQGWWRRWVASVRCFRQYVKQPAVICSAVLFTATNVGNIKSLLGISGLKTATAERSHKMMYRVYVTKNFAQNTFLPYFGTRKHLFLSMQEKQKQCMNFVLTVSETVDTARRKQISCTNTTKIKKIKKSNFWKALKIFLSWTERGTTRI